MSVKQVRIRNLNNIYYKMLHVIKVINIMCIKEHRWLINKSITKKIVSNFLISICYKIILNIVLKLTMIQ